MNTNIDQAIAQANEWLRLDGVEGIAQGEQDGQPCILVLASRPEAEIKALLPETLLGFPVMIQDIGIIQAE